jgi:uncharacterized phage-associated protein
MASALDIARYFLSKAAAEPDEPELMTQLRLQKLLYYAQAWALAYRAQPLFPEIVEAWVNGPVVREVFAEFKDCRSEPLPAREARVPSAISAQDRAFLDSIWQYYKRFSATELRAMTHHEDPWRTARGGLPVDAKTNAEITHESMRDFFARRRAIFERETEISAEELAAAEASRSQGRWTSLRDARRKLGHAV